MTLNLPEDKVDLQNSYILCKRLMLFEIICFRSTSSFCVLSVVTRIFTDRILNWKYWMKLKSGLLLCSDKSFHVSEFLVV